MFETALVVLLEEPQELHNFPSDEMVLLFLTYCILDLNISVDIRAIKLQ